MKAKLGPVDVRAMVAFVRGFKDGKQVVEDEPEVSSEPAKTSDRRAAAVDGSRPGTSGDANRAHQAQRGINKNFQRFCARCHGASGDGSNARDTLRAIPNFTSSAWQDKRTDPQLTVSILDGKGTEMPAFRSKVSRDQARELVSFIRGFSTTPKRSSRAAPDDFEDRFRTLETELLDLIRQSRALSSRAPSAPAGPAAKDAKE
jgi:mono/diheme cytochrome c family protein